jgi:hypothetical protein
MRMTKSFFKLNGKAIEPYAYVPTQQLKRSIDWELFREQITSHTPPDEISTIPVCYGQSHLA